MEPENVATLIGMVESAWGLFDFNVLHPTWKPSLRTFIVIVYLAYQPYISISYIVGHLQELDVLSECISINVAAFQIIIRMIAIYFSRPVVMQMMDFLRSQRQLFQSNSRIHALQDEFIVRTIFVVKCLRLLYHSTIFFVLIPIVFPDPKKYNLPFAYHLPHIPPDQTPFYELNYLYQTFGLLLGQQILFGADALIVIALMGACAQISALKLSLQDPCNDDRTDDALLEIIRIHIIIKDYIGLAKGKLRVDLLVIFCSVCMVVCLSLNVIVMDYRTAIYFYMLAAIFQLFVVCYSGNQLLMENDTLSDYVYSVNWMAMSSSRQKMVQFLLANVQPDVQLDAIFMPLNMASFMAVMKASYSYFTILN